MKITSALWKYDQTYNFRLKTNEKLWEINPTCLQHTQRFIGTPMGSMSWLVLFNAATSISYELLNNVAVPSSRLFAAYIHIRFLKTQKQGWSVRLAPIINIETIVSLLLNTFPSPQYLPLSPSQFTKSLFSASSTQALGSNQLILQIFMI